MRLSPRRYRLLKLLAFIFVVLFAFHVVNKILSFHLVVNSVIYFSNEQNNANRFAIPIEQVNQEAGHSRVSSSHANGSHLVALQMAVKRVTDKPRPKCIKKKHIVFLKTHKCGSSTLQNIFLRFGDTNKLHFVLPKTYNYIGHAPVRFNRRLIMDPALLRTRYNLSYSILTHHTRFNYKEMKLVMPSDAVYITVMRDPVQLFESLYSYYDLGTNIYGTQNLTLDEFLRLVVNRTAEQNDLKIPTTEADFWSFSRLFSSLLYSIRTKFDSNKRFLGKFGRNQMAFDLGFNSKYFEEDIYIENFIRHIDAIFDLVLIAERMDESLILLKDKLCWDISEVVAFRHNPRAKQFVSLPLNQSSQQLVKMYNKADDRLYQYFSDKFERKVQKYGRKRMEQDVKILRNLTDHYYEKCVSSEEMMSRLVPPKFQPNKRALVFRQKVLNSVESDLNMICKQLTLPEVLYTERLRNRQKAKLLAIKMASDKVLVNNFV